MVPQLLGPHCVAEIVLVVLEGLVHVDHHPTVVLRARPQALLIQNGKHTLRVCVCGGGGDRERILHLKCNNLDLILMCSVHAILVIS